MRIICLVCDFCKQVVKRPALEDDTFAEIEPSGWVSYDVESTRGTRTESVSFLVCGDCLSKRLDRGIKAIFREWFKRHREG